MPDLAALSATAGVCGAPTIPRRAGSLVATKDVPAQGPATRRDTKANERTRQRTPQCRSELCAVTRRPSVGPNVPPPGLVGVLAEQSWEIPPLDDGARATIPKLSGSEAGGYAHRAPARCRPRWAGCQSGPGPRARPTQHRGRRRQRHAESDATGADVVGPADGSRTAKVALVAFTTSRNSGGSAST